MSGDKHSSGPVKTRAYLIDPESMEVLWMNEAAVAPSIGVSQDRLPTVAQAVPMAESLGLPAMVTSVAENGTPQHLRTDLISTGKGSMGLSSSVYRLPDGNILLLTEDAWRSGREDRTSDAARRGHRRD